MAIERIQFRRGTAAQWAAANPVLAEGEPGFETDTNQEKRGDGTTAWSALPYIGGSGGASSAADLTFAPTGNIAATNVQAALAELDSEKIATSARGVANGVASLGADGLVPSSQLPASSPSGGGSVLLKQVTLAAAAASIDFTASDIPTSGYSHLRIRLIGRGTSATTGDSVNLAINGDTTAANYTQQRLYGTSATVGAAGGSAERRIGFVDAANDPAGVAGLVDMEIVDYRGSWQKMAHSKSAKTGAPIIDFVGLRWKNTAAVTSVTLTCAGGNFVAGTKAWLYGVL